MSQVQEQPQLVLENTASGMVSSAFGTGATANKKEQSPLLVGMTKMLIIKLMMQV